MSAEKPLAGRTVLIPRPEERARSLASMLEALGARVLVRPTIAFEPPTDPGPARRALERLAAYSWIVFTSPTAVAFFREEHARSDRAGFAAQARIAAIGPGTARALASAGLVAELVATDSRAEGLAALFEGLDVQGARMLLVRPEAAREMLPERLRSLGASVDAVAFYRTVAAPTAAAAVAELLGGTVDAVVLSSPSTLQGLLGAGGSAREALEGALARTRRVAIGAFTAEALAEALLPAHAVAASATDEAIAQALLSALRP